MALCCLRSLPTFWKMYSTPLECTNDIRCVCWFYLCDRYADCFERVASLSQTTLTTYLQNVEGDWAPLGIMSKKSAASAADAAGDVPGVSRQDLKDIFAAFYGNEMEYEALRQEHYDLTHYHELKAEQEKELVAERRRKRREICEARRLQEEMRRIKEMRDNPQNLFQCAAKIQKYVRRNIIMKRYARAKASLLEKPNKEALVIIASHYEDRRVRVDPQAVQDAWELAKTMAALGFRVTLLADTVPYDDFVATVDEPMAQQDASGRPASLSAIAAMTGGASAPSQLQGTAARRLPQVPPGAGGAAVGTVPMSSAAVSSGTQQPNLSNQAPQPPSAADHDTPKPTPAAPRPAQQQPLPLPTGMSSLMRHVKPPTRQNMLAAIEQISAAPSETLVWVHVCCVGGRATVNGRNPSRAAGDAQIKTPRTRLVHALQQATQNKLASAQGASSQQNATSDSCHFLMPTDAKSSRLTFDSILRVEEILDVLSPRHSEQIFGHPLHHRVVSLEVTPIGCVEGQVGGGFSVFGTTCTATRFWEIPGKLPTVGAPEQGANGAVSGGVQRSCALGDPYVSLLTFGLQHCLVGQCWTKSLDGTPMLHASHMVDYLDRWMAVHQTVCDIRGSRGWGSFRLLEGDRLASNMVWLERVLGSSTCVAAAFSVSGGGGLPHAAGGGASIASTSGGSTPPPAPLSTGAAPPPLHVVRKTATAAPRYGHAASGSNRAVAFEVTMRMDLTDERLGVRGLDVCDTEFQPLFTAILQFFAQPDVLSGAVSVHGQTQHAATGAHAAQHRFIKIPPMRQQLSRSLLIGIQSTFIEVTAKTKHRAGGGDSTPAPVWTDLVAELMDVSPSLVAATVPFSVTIAKPHEGGGILLTIPVVRQELWERILRRLDTISNVIPGVSYNMVMAEIRAEAFASAQVVEQLTLRARHISAIPSPLGLVQPMASVADGEGGDAAVDLVGDANLEAPSSVTPIFAATSLPTSSPQPQQQRDHPAVSERPKQPSPTAIAVQGGPYGRPRNGAVAVLGVKTAAGAACLHHDRLTKAIVSGVTFSLLPSCASPTPQLLAAWDEFLDHCVQSLGARVTRSVKLLRQKLAALRIMCVKILPHRVNELDDATVAILMRRERPPTPLATHAGTAVCVVAMLGPTGEARCRQLLHLQRVAQTMDLIGGVRFMLWDVNGDNLGLVPPIATTPSNVVLSGASAGAGATHAAAAMTLLATGHSGKNALAGGGGGSPSSMNDSSKSPANDGQSHPRAALQKFLEALRLAIGTNATAYPCLMLWDLCRRRYYRLKSIPTQLQAGGAPSTAASGKAPFTTSLAPLKNAPPLHQPNSLPSSNSGTVTPALSIELNPSMAGDTSMRSPPAASPMLSDDGVTTAGGGKKEGHAASSSNNGLHFSQHVSATAHLLYSSVAIAHFCDEFLRGGLNELLPPVRGSKVVGGGHSTTKYALVPI